MGSFRKNDLMHWLEDAKGEGSRAEPCRPHLKAGTLNLRSAWWWVRLENFASASIPASFPSALSRSCNNDVRNYSFNWLKKFKGRIESDSNVFKVFVWVRL